MIRAKDITFSYGSELVFDKTSFIITEGQKVGMVGPNGAGKSTLFSIITNKLELDAGSIETTGTVGYVPQEVKQDPSLEESLSVRDYIDPEKQKSDFELKKLLAGLELDHVALLSKPKILSGGQKTKLALARALIQEPDLLLLDEPVNFMDSAGKRFVMNFLSQYPKSLMIVSHNLDLLDEHIDKVLILNIQSKKIETYAGTYKKAMKLKEEQEEHFKRQVRVKEKHIEQMEKSLLKLYRNKSKKGVRARMQHIKRIGQEKSALPAMPTAIKKFKLDLPEPSRIAELPIMVKGINKSYGDNKVLKDLSFYVNRGEKILITGDNGAGKSTLIKIIMNKIKADTGTVLIKENVQIGYYSQEFETFDFSKRVLDTVMEECGIYEQKARSFLGRFMFDADNVKQRVGTLSGGEKTRLSVAMIMLNNNNLLVLDEPTTYLDPLSQRIVLEALKEYKGTLVLVSHVDEFVKELKPDRAFLMPEGELITWFSTQDY